MYGVLIALLPALLVSFWFFGIGSAIVCATSVVACVFFGVGHQQVYAQERA